MSQVEKHEHGGKREGAELFTPGPACMLQRTVTLPAEVIEKLGELGDSNLSAGLRQAGRRLYPKGAQAREVQSNTAKWV